MYMKFLHFIININNYFASLLEFYLTGSTFLRYEYFPIFL